MTLDLDYVEWICRSALASEQSPNFSVGPYDMDRIAKAVIAMIPVVNAAADLQRGCDCDYDYRCDKCQAVLDVREAVDAMNAALEECK